MWFGCSCNLSFFLLALPQHAGVKTIRQSSLSALDMPTPKTPFIYPLMQIDVDKLKVYPKLKSFKNLLWLQRRFF